MTHTMNRRRSDRNRILASVFCILCDTTYPDRWAYKSHQDDCIARFRSKKGI